MRRDLIPFLCYLKTTDLNPVSSITVSDKEMVAMPFLSGVSPYFCLHQGRWSCVLCRSDGTVQFWLLLYLVECIQTLNLDNKSNVYVFWFVNRIITAGSYFYCLLRYCIFSGSWNVHFNSFHSFVLRCIHYVWCYSLIYERLYFCASQLLAVIFFIREAALDSPPRHIKLSAAF